MRGRGHLLISLESRHAENILAGKKRVELRRRRMHVSEGDIVWLYVKSPVAAVVGCAVVGQCMTDGPAALWKHCGDISGLVRSEFMSYFNGVTEAFAMGVRDPKSIERPVSLVDLRKVLPKFHPPQFYCWLDSASALRKLLVVRSRV
ncbi:ASCH domain-containing protein [Trinickia caryophylli]|nr:ASCH domain-containing protein [Trinickia caryophylli]TRX17110.1 ASCH domain-containing protein [Trinickia caryophylli]